MRPHIRGRRRSLDQQKKVEICDLVAQGASVEEAADAVDVSVRTVQREAKFDEDFDHELKLAQRATPDPLKIMESAARTHWRAAAWLLERTDPETYGRRPASSCSPFQFEEALRTVLEAALEVAEPQQRAAVYNHVQAACGRAFKGAFPNYGPGGRRLSQPLAPTPLADAERLNYLRNRHSRFHIPDYDDETRTPCVLGPVECSVGARTRLHVIERSELFLNNSPSSDSVHPASIMAHPPLDESVSDRTAQPPDLGPPSPAPLNVSLGATSSAPPTPQSPLFPPDTSASVLHQPILSPKTHSATEFNGDKILPPLLSIPHRHPTP